MSEEVADRLRSLVKDYQNGRLTFPEYRRLRTSLLDSLDRQPGTVGAEVITQPRSPAAAPPPPDDVGTVRRLPRLERRKYVTLSRSQWIGALAVGLMIAILGAVLILNRGGRERAGVPESRGPVSSDRIYAVIAPLLNSPDWGEARIAAVNASLLEEGARQITARQQTEWFQRFAAEVRRRLENQRAAGAEELVPEKSSLAALAVTIGLDLNDLDAPLMPPARGGSGSTSRLPDRL
jgi:hypothetical protein